MNNNIDVIVAHANRVLPLDSACLGDEYYYQSLSLCIIDAVYSIGVRYEGVKTLLSDIAPDLTCAVPAQPKARFHSS
ncbi:MAG: hypothetical protein WDM70_09955 [Nitrosomonadales bacterium]